MQRKHNEPVTRKLIAVLEVVTTQQELLLLHLDLDVGSGRITARGTAAVDDATLATSSRTEGGSLSAGCVTDGSSLLNGMSDSECGFLAVSSVSGGKLSGCGLPDMVIDSDGWSRVS